MVFLLLVVQTAWAWDGEGTSSNPYLISSTTDWNLLAQSVVGGNSYSGQFFRMTADIDAGGLSVGTENMPFSGTFDGDGHTLTFDRGGSTETEFVLVDSDCAPFVRLDGATIRHLNVAGAVYSNHKYAAGIAMIIDGSGQTTILDCHVSSTLYAGENVKADATFGGLVGVVQPSCTDDLVITDCTFTGRITMWASYSSGMVGWANRPVKFKNCLFDPKEVPYTDGNATFVRMTTGVESTFEECYFTMLMGTAQGKCIFTEVLVPNGCKAQILSEPLIRLYGKKYYGSGTKVRLTVPEGTQFDHWVDNNGSFISDPWTANGVHTISDPHSKPSLGIATSMPEASTSREQKGINYRFLSQRDYKLFMSDSLRVARGYQFDDSDDHELFVYDSNGDQNYITVVWNCDANAETFQNYYREGWFWTDKNYEGCVILNDLIAEFRKHTHLFAIAPRAFLNTPQLKRIVFISDMDPTFASNCRMGIDVQIQEQAFKDSGIEELVMMYRNQGANNSNGSWDIIGPTTGVTVAANAFEGTSGTISVDPGVYQSYLSDRNWDVHQNRIAIYAAKIANISQSGAVYSYWQDSQAQPVKNNAEGHASLMQTLKTWNSNHLNFNAADLLAEEGKENVWYLQVTGVDDSSLDNGKMIIRNDPGTYYNYKTLSIAPNAFADNENLQYIEFEQVVGNRNSYSDLKMVIHNGAFKGCKNLKELRLFYHVNTNSDGSSGNLHWMSLGPQDVILGNNIFGLDRLTQDQIARLANGEDISSEFQTKGVPEDFRILVAPERMAEFMADPNWAPYLSYIEAADLTPTSASDEFTIDGSDGLTYAYITNLGGIRETSQTVSQDLSWWTLPRIAVELAMHVVTIGLTYVASQAAAGTTVGEAAAAVTKATQNQTIINTVSEATHKAIGQVVRETNGTFTYNWFKNTATSIFANWGKKDLTKIAYMKDLVSAEAKQALIDQGWLSQEFIFKESLWSLTNEQVYQGLLILKEPLEAAARQVALDVTAATARHAAIVSSLVGSRIAQGLSATTLASGIVAQAAWNGYYNSEALKKGMRENIRSNMHEFTLQAGSYVLMSPTKNLVYHSYLKRVSDETEDAVIYAGTDDDQGRNASCVTMTFARDAFQNHTNLKTVKFHENNISSHEGMPMLLTIPDSAFYGCTNLVEFSTIVESSNGSQVLGPESFILAGDNVFVDLDPEKFHILIDESRKDDYLASESWAPLAKYFKYVNIKPDTKYNEYGGKYAYAYENGSLQKIHKVQGHTIEHMVVSEPDNDFLTGHQGGLKLCNDIGVFNNYQLDAVRYKAFFGNQNLRVVNFTDLKGTTGFGDTYTDLEVTLQDSCFANCTNLANLDMLYLVTDGTNRIDPITPQQVKLGRGVLHGTTAKIKMMPQQVEWFQKDTTWAKYSDRFMPSVIKVADDDVRDILSEMAYYDFAHTGYDDVLWTDYIDLARIAGCIHGFDWLSGKFKNQGIHSFNEFRHFASVGLDKIGVGWFQNCSNLTSISLPSTLTKILDDAFNGCTSLTAIEIPENVNQIWGGAFAGCTSLQTIRVRGRVPADFFSLTTSDFFPKNEGMKIYVPDGTVDTYKQAWPDYAEYIVSDKTMKNRKVITVTEPGQLAQELELTLFKEYDKVHYVRGEYASIDSLTVTGPLNGEDLAVIRHLAGADAYDSDPTDGCLKYLNLWNAQLKKDEVNSYNGNGGDEYIDADNKVPDYLFENCTSIQTVIFPKTATYIGENIFEDATSLRKVCVGYATTGYECDIFQSLPGIEELVLLTDGHATSDYRDPWEADIATTFTTNAQVGNYMGDIYLMRRSNYVVAPFKDDAVMRTLADRGLFFPSDYMDKENVTGLFSNNTTITDLSDFNHFARVKDLNGTFAYTSKLRTITLPDSLETISAVAFAGCTNLESIYVSCDSVPKMAAHALDDLPSNFRIFVPKRLCKHYRTRWAEYADHIYVNESLYDNSDIITVTLDAVNTLAQKLGLTYGYGGSVSTTCIHGLSGDYSHVRKLKVVGPISGADFDVIRHLAGWCPCERTRNLAGHLEYLDLYDADIRASHIGINGENSAASGSSSHVYSVDESNVMPYHALLKAYNLKTLILPKSCTKVEERALQECEGLEVIVIGDNTTEFNWNALDDDASLTRMYFLTNQKVQISTQNAIWNALCNNYNPTFDAFYVRPSQLELYRNDPNYTGSSWQRTNNIQSGIFTDDEQFLPFAAHAAVTYDDLAAVTDVNGWFSSHTDLKDLSTLAYTSLRSLRYSDLQELTNLEKIVLPATFEHFYDNTLQYDESGYVIADGLDHRPFANSYKLRYLNMLLCDSAMIIDNLRGSIKQQLGINDDALVYVPASYGATDEQNVIWGNVNNLQNNYYNINEQSDYYVPLSFTSRHIINSRTLQPKKMADGTTNMEESKYTVCLPYSMPVPAGAKAFKLNGRSGNTLIFTEEQNTMAASTPYLLVLTDNSVLLNSDTQQTIPTTTEAEAALLTHQSEAPGLALRGTLKAIDNTTANQLGSYILQSDNKWHLVPSGVEAANIPAFRAYLLQRDSGAGVKAFDMQFDEVDGVDTILTVDRDGNETYYDLSGRKLNGRPQRGVYIHHGKKYVNK